MTGKTLRLIVAAYVSAAVGCAAQTVQPPPAASPAGGKPPLTVYFLDVGQGDSTLITTPAGKNILIDAGMGGDLYKAKDKAKTVIIPFLKEKGITTLDMAIMTHADFDHIGGFVYLLNNTKAGSEYPLRIREFLDPGQPHTTHLYQQVLEAVKNRPEIKYRNPKNGEMLDFGEGVTAQVLGPHRIFDDPNNSSIVLKVSSGGVSFILPGDAEAESEKFMIADYDGKLKATVLKAGHHGSGGSSSAGFLALVKPETVVISVGEKNKFLLPDKQGLGRLKGTGAKIYRTDYQGMITIATDGTTCRVTAAREAPPPDKRWDEEVVLTERQKLNINTASRAEIEQLPRIGKDLAKRIIAKRPYKSVDDLRKVSGIGAKILERLRPLITVGEPGAGAAAAQSPAATAPFELKGNIEKAVPAAPARPRAGLLIPRPAAFPPAGASAAAASC